MKFIKNTGNDKFNKIWTSKETDNTWSISWGDYDNDGFLDLLSGNYNQINRVHKK